MKTLNNQCQTNQEKKIHQITQTLIQQTSTKQLLLENKNFNRSQIGQNIIKHKEHLLLDMLNQIHNQCKFQYEFILISLIEERDDQRKYYNYSNLIQINEQLVNLKNQFNKKNQEDDKQDIIHPDYSLSVYKRLINIKHCLNLFKEKKTQRIINDIIKSSVDQELRYRKELNFEYQLEEILILLNNYLQNQICLDKKVQRNVKSVLAEYSQQLIILANFYFMKQQYQNAIKKYSKYKLLSCLDQKSEINLGICLYKLKQYQEAFLLFNNLIKRSQQIEILYYLGIKFIKQANIYMANQNYSDALILYDKTLEIQSKFIKSYSKKAMIYKILNNKRENDMYNIILEHEPKNEKILNRQVMWYYFNEQYKEAKWITSKLIDINPRNDSYYNNQGCIIQKLGNTEEAVQFYDKAIQLNPNYITYNNKGMLLEKLRQYHKAQKQYEQAIKLNPINYNAYYNKGQLLQKIHQPEEALLLYDKVILLNPNDKAYYNKGRLNEALQMYNKAIQLNPQNFHYKIGLGSLFENLGRLDEALDIYNYAIQQSPANPSAYSNKALLYEKLGRIDEAIKYYDRAIQINPDNDVYYNNKGLNYLMAGNLLEKLGKTNEAITLFDRALAINPQDSVTYYNKGYNYVIEGCLLAKLGQTNEALQNYDRAIHLDWKNDSFYNSKGLLIKQLGRLEEAMDLFDRAIELNPYNDKAYNNKGQNDLTLGLLEKQLGRTNEALKLYDRALQINPNDCITYNNKGFINQTLGQLFSSLGKFEEAIIMYDQAIKINPNYGDVYNNKGYNLYDGKLREAIQFFDISIQLNPQNDNAYNNKGLLLKKLGRMEEAIQLYDHAIQLNPGCDGYYNNKGQKKLNLGYLLEELGRFAEALQQYNKAISLNQKNDSVYSNKGQNYIIVASLLEKFGRQKEALELYDIAIKINPKNDIAHQNKGLDFVIIALLLEKQGHQVAKKFKSSIQPIQYYPKFDRASVMANVIIQGLSIRPEFNDFPEGIILQSLKIPFQQEGQNNDFEIISQIQNLNALFEFLKNLENLNYSALDHWELEQKRSINFYDFDYLKMLNLQNQNSIIKIGFFHKLILKYLIRTIFNDKKDFNLNIYPQEQDQIDETSSFIQNCKALIKKLKNNNKKFQKRQIKYICNFHKYILLINKFQSLGALGLIDDRLGLLSYDSLDQSFLKNNKHLIIKNTI